MNKTYQELTVEVKDTFIDLIADYILNICDDAIEIGSNKIIVRSESDLSSVKDSLLSLAEELGDSFEISFQLNEKENQDWIKRYQDSVQPIEAGKFYIFPSWYEEKEGFVNIKIDPALAFGSGHHATTFSCLKAIDTYVKKGDSVIDVGCGSGILGLACKKLGTKIDLCDTDPVSVNSCKENFKLNSETYQNLWEGSIDKREEKYDVVIANIIADILKLLSSDLKSAMKENGILILSGILDKKEERVRESFSDLHLAERVLKDEWVTLVYKEK